MDRRSFLAGTAGFPLFLGLSRKSQDRDFDVLVRGGTVVDGSGAPPFRSDVGIRGEMVASVSDLNVRDERLMPLEEAVRRMASLPAERFALARRGRLAEGFFADIAVFDPARVRDRATFEQPHQYAEGFEAVLVNGALVLEGGSRTEALPGKVIRGSLHRA